MILSIIRQIRSEQFWKERLIAGIITITYLIGNVIELVSEKITEDPPALWVTAIILGILVQVVSVSNFKKYTSYFFYAFLIWINIHTAFSYSMGTIKHREAEEFYLLTSYIVFIIVSQIIESNRALILFCAFEVIIFSIAVYFVKDYDPLLLRPLQFLMALFIIVGSYAVGYIRIMRTQVNPNSDIEFKTISESARDGQVIIDTKMRFAYLNPAASTITGYSNQELMKISITDLIHADDVNTVKSALGSILHGNADRLSVEYRVVNPNNKEVWVESILSRFVTGSLRQNKFVFAETRDISQRKVLEAEIQQQLLAEELLIKHSNRFINLDRNEIQPNIDIALKEFAGIINADGILVYRMFGKLSEEFRSTNQWFAKTDDSVKDKFNLVVKINQPLIAFLRHLKTDKTSRGIFVEASQLFDIQVLRVAIAAGKRFYLVPLPSGNVVNGFIAIVLDEMNEPKQPNFFSLIGNMVSNAFTRLRTETRLHEVQLTNEFILRALPDWLYIIDKGGEFTGINNYSSLQSYLPDYNLVGKNIQEILPEDLHLLFKDALDKIIESESPVSFEYKDSAIYKGRYFKATLAPFKTNEYIIIIRDITDLKEAQSELETKAEKLEKSNQELEQFAYIVSHDMKQPIRSIISFLGLLKRKHGVNLSEEAQEYIGFSIESANKMDNLIKDILQYSRLDRQIEFVNEVNLATVTTNVLRTLTDIIATSNATVTIAPLPTVIGNETMLTELFQNLIENGIKYNTSPAKTVEVSVKQDGDFWKFTVKDNGIGFDKQHSEQIFKIFKRLHTDDEFKGTGIGLTICQKVVEKHGGTIVADSEVGKGSTFTFTLPKKSV